MNESDRDILASVVKQQHQANRPGLNIHKYFEIFTGSRS
jgi:hypothetical protein